MAPQVARPTGRCASPWRCSDVAAVFALQAGGVFALQNGALPVPAQSMAASALARASASARLTARVPAPAAPAGSSIFALQSGPGGAAVFAPQSPIAPGVLAGAAMARATAAGLLVAKAFNAPGILSGAAIGRAIAQGALNVALPLPKLLRGAAQAVARASGQLYGETLPARLMAGAALARAVAAGRLVATVPGISTLSGAARAVAHAAGQLRAVAPTLTSESLTGTSSELRRVIVEGDSSGALGSFVKQPRESLDYCFDFGPWLRDCNDTLSGHTLLLASGAGLVIAGSARDASSVVVLVTQGTDKKRAKLTCIATTVGGRTKEAEIVLRVKEV